MNRLNVIVAGATAAGVAALVFSVVTAENSGSEIRDLQGQVASQQAQLSSDHAKLTGNRPDVITCTDFRTFEQNVQMTVNGLDAYGNTVTGSASINNSWLPGHCYNP